MAGQWFRYTVDVAAAGTYAVGFRVASPRGVIDGLHLASSAGVNLSGAVNVPGTGGSRNWAMTTATVKLPAGRQTLTVDQDNGGWSITSMTFTATKHALTRALIALPSSLSFGNQTAGTTSSARAVTVSNPNGTAVPAPRLALSGPFGQTSSCEASIPAHRSCTVSVTFAPRAAGWASGSLTVVGKVPGSSLTVTLSGLGVAARSSTRVAPSSAGVAPSSAGVAPTTNLALNKPTYGSSLFQNYVPSNAVDGNPLTYWESLDGAGYPQTLTVNLGSVQTIGSITLDLPPLSDWNTRTETLTVLGSTDGSTFTQIVGSAGYTFNVATGNTATFSLPSGTVAQYVRLSFTANTGWDAAQVSEFEIFP
jgi:hypothetical protein